MMSDINIDTKIFNEETLINIISINHYKMDDRSIAKLIIHNNIPIIKLLLENNYITYDYFFRICRDLFDQNTNMYLDHLYTNDSMMPNLIIKSVSVLTDEFLNNDNAQYLSTKLIKSLRGLNEARDKAIPTIRRLINLGAKILSKIITYTPTEIFLEHATPEMFNDYDNFQKCVRQSNTHISNWLIDQIEKQTLYHNIEAVITMSDYYKNKIVFDYYLKYILQDEILLNIVILNKICCEYKIDMGWIPKSFMISDHIILISRIIGGECINSRLDFNDNVRVVVSQNIHTYVQYSAIYNIVEDTPLNIEKYNKYIKDADIILNFLKDESINGLGN